MNPCTTGNVQIITHITVNNGFSFYFIFEATCFPINFSIISDLFFWLFFLEIVSKGQLSSIVKLNPNDPRARDYVALTEEQVVESRWKQVSNWPLVQNV
jgi:hypothetical protein